MRSAGLRMSRMCWTPRRSCAFRRPGRSADARPSVVRGLGLDGLGRLGAARDRDAAEAVAVVDVVAELDEAVRGRPGGDVGPVDVNRLRQLAVDALAGLDRRLDVLAVPAGAVLQEPGDVVAHVLD